MNKYETLYRSSRMAARVVGSAVSRTLEVRRGEEPTPTLYTLLCSSVADRLGIRRGSVEEKRAKKVVTAITRSWFKADAILDEEAIYSEIDQEKLAQERNTALNTRLIIDESVSQNLRERVQDMEMSARKKAYEVHTSFMSSFDPTTSTFEDVLRYRANTSGLMGETIVDAIYIVSGSNGDITALKENVLSESLCLQMCDDLVDSVSDYRKGLPNLLYALTLENPSERSRFEAASVDEAIIDTRRPYDIVQLAASATLLSYIRKFKTMASILPSDRRQFVLDSISTTTHLSYSPNATVGKINRTEISKMLARRTKLD